MTWERQPAYAKEEGKIESARNLLKKSSLSPELIADCCSLLLEEVLALKEELAHKAEAVPMQ